MLLELAKSEFFAYSTCENIMQTSVDVFDLNAYLVDLSSDFQPSLMIVLFIVLSRNKP